MLRSEYQTLLRTEAVDYSCHRVCSATEILFHQIWPRLTLSLAMFMFDFFILYIKDPTFTLTDLNLFYFFGLFCILIPYSKL